MTTNAKMRQLTTTECADLWSDCVFQESSRQRRPSGPFRLGVLRGEGIGPDVIQAALEVLAAIESVCPHRFEVREGGLIGREAEERCGRALSDEVMSFCRDLFDHKGALLCGPGGGRFVYNLRKQFDLFCKLSPLRATPELFDATRLKPDVVRNADILLVRENVAGIYQGHWSESQSTAEGRRAEQSFAYSEREVRRILEVAARIAKRRRGEMTVVIKDGGIPLISDLWRDCGLEVAAREDVRASFMNVDHAAYRLVQTPGDFDVLVCPNLFGDILADLGGVLLGSRGISFSGNFASTGEAAYQTNHGAGHDLFGKDRANPVAQIFSFAMLLRESFGLTREATLIEHAVSAVWREGWRTFDLMHNGSRLVGTREMGKRIADSVVRLARQAD